MRRRLPWWVLALLFVGIPLVEVYLIVQLGQAVGPWWTILVLIAAGALGSYLMKREGSRAWRALQQALADRRMPAKELADGALILIGGTLLLTPGFMSDVVGLFCILPFTRPLARRALTRLVARRLVVATPGPGPLPGFGAPGFGASGFGTRPGPPQGPAGRPTAGPEAPPRTRGPGHDDVVRGEVVDEEE